MNSNVTLATHADLLGALHHQANVLTSGYLLGHAEDGIIWGRIEKGMLMLASGSSSIKPPCLRASTLLEARLFNPSGEFYIWRDSDTWRSRLLLDNHPADISHRNETLLLWGTDEIESLDNDFALVQERELGIYQTLPLRWRRRRGAKLVLRHYLDFTSDGEVFVKYSRLVDLLNGEK